MNGDLGTIENCMNSYAVTVRDEVAENSVSWTSTLSLESSVGRNCFRVADHATGINVDGWKIADS